MASDLILLDGHWKTVTEIHKYCFCSHISQTSFNNKKCLILHSTYYVTWSCYHRVCIFLIFTRSDGTPMFTYSGSSRSR